ncbi:PucR family transcriptional regulator [Mycobacterium marinum]|uniref:PucR family transcriptional regulator n=1 Tax=Mycobacterium marinum TaxID=1781 RepID=UPI000B97599E|nr:PucR family transcriptional regulator [Mycobacterium marinum]MDC8982292.1 PucR family transcriptional regulator [Mycobacterium marinum]MDC8994832.1 PucR family transcriptional regulator [Mycobacterium marinum]MDC9000429.1 PucR family transcriptional regulator [Mycobacterium marinum]MDC9011583.1 PucR family transcriptional regulator [Mycobacterium marinum]MDC9017282.1 PucR family transcriptional regulator [Mycobacterium marinum]
MNDNQFSAIARLGSARSPLELLETVPDSLLRRLKQYSGRLATEAVSAMQERLPFFADLEASQRASVALVVQTAVVNFAEWMQNPRSDVSYTAQAFELVPQDLTRRIALRHTVDMVRVTMEFFEEVVPLLARSEEQLTALTVGILKYSRDLAFTAASAYADAAEARGTWDSRMEASVVDAVVRGDTGPELLSRAAALNWDTTAPATVVVGTPASARDGSDGSERAIQDVRDAAAQHGRAALTDVHGTWLVAIVSGHLSPTDKVFKNLLEAFSDGPVVIGPTAPMLTAAYHSASEAISGMNAVAGWRGAPRPVLARELLPERALMGDASAIVALHTDVMRPLADAGPTLIETLDAYLDCGGAIEACARKLFVHPNTIRYRLKRITDFTGRDPTQPRDAYVLRVAATVGQLNYPTPPSGAANNTITPVPLPVRRGTEGP